MKFSICQPHIKFLSQNIIKKQEHQPEIKNLKIITTTNSLLYQLIIKKTMHCSLINDLKHEEKKNRVEEKV
jgi:hypothetical protein